jgi:hypothetical protein
MFLVGDFRKFSGSLVISHWSLVISHWSLVLDKRQRTNDKSSIMQEFFRGLEQQN